MPDRDVFPFLRLPVELQLDVFDFLAFDTGTLHSDILVNRIWYERAVGLLWSSPPDPLRALSQIERSRRPRYADLIRTLILTRSDMQLEPSVRSSDAFVNFMQSCRHFRSITISQNTSKTPTTCIPPFLATNGIEQTRCIAQNLEELVFYDFARVRSRESEFSPSKHPIWGKSNHFLRSFGKAYAASCCYQKHMSRLIYKQASAHLDSLPSTMIETKDMAPQTCGSL